MISHAVPSNIAPSGISTPRAHDITYWSMWLFIVFVSVWDSYLTLIHRTEMQFCELNPIGRALIELNGGGVLFLLMAKAAGTLLVMSVLATLYDHNPRRAFVVTTPITCFQLALLAFLTLS